MCHGERFLVPEEGPCNLLKWSTDFPVLTFKGLYPFHLQVAIMQQEIIELQPELIKTSEETRALMVKIEKDTVEAEAKKEVS